MREKAVWTLKKVPETLNITIWCQNVSFNPDNFRLSAKQPYRIQTNAQDAVPHVPTPPHLKLLTVPCISLKGADAQSFQYQASVTWNSPTQTHPISLPQLPPQTKPTSKTNPHPKPTSLTPPPQTHFITTPKPKPTSLPPPTNPPHYLPQPTSLPPQPKPTSLSPNPPHYPIPTKPISLPHPSPLPPNPPH